MSATHTTTISTGATWSGGKSPYNVSYGKIMMWFFLVSDAFSFGALLISLWTTRFSGRFGNKEKRCLLTQCFFRACSGIFDGG